MNFFLDENIPKSVVKYLTKQGNSVFDIRATKNEGAEDSIIFEMAQKEHAIFVTTDRDFFHTIPYLFEKHCGVIVIALRQPNSIQIKNKIIWALDNLDFSTFTNKILLLKDNQYTISGK